MRTRNAWLLAACATIAASGATSPLRADDAAAPPAAPGPQLHAQAQVSESEPSPITLRLQYAGEAAANPIGGLHNGATYMNNILAQFHVDTDKAFGWTGGRFVVEAFYENANSLASQFVGSAQDPSSIDNSGVAMVRLYQAFYKQDLGGTNLLFGLYDPQTEFGTTDPMSVFFNGAYAWTTTLDQSGLNGPSTYPDTSLAFRVQQGLGSRWSVQAAVLDGVPDSLKRPAANTVNINRLSGALLLAEADYTPSDATKLLAGYWHYTGKFAAIGQAAPNGTGRQVFGSTGAYVGGATRLYSQTDTRGLDIFANIGIADASTVQIDRSLSVGLTYIGPFDDRPADRFGLAAGLARAGNAYRHMQVASGNRVETYETNFEMTYRAKVTDWLTIQPDIQYWINPNMDPTLKNDLLFLIHFELSHIFDF